MKVGLLQEGFNVCEKDVADLVMGTAQSLEKAGATVEKISIPMHEQGES